MGRFNLTEISIPHWKGVEVDCEVSLALLREDLGVNREFFVENDAKSFADMTARFYRAEAYWTPISYRARSMVIAASFEWTVTWTLQRRVGPGVFRKMRDLEGGYSWEREANDVVFELHVDRRYRKLLTVGGGNPDEAAQNWDAVAQAVRRTGRNG